MILFFNIFLTSGGLKHSYNRGGLPKEDNFDIFLASIKSIYNLYSWSSVLLQIKLDSCYESRRKELKDYLDNLFKNQKNYTLRLGFRCEYQHHWQEVINSFDDDLILYSCNHDHIFIGNPDYFKECIKTVEKYKKEDTIFALSHFPDYIPLCKSHKYEIDGPVFKVNVQDTGSFNLLTKSLLKKWWCEIDLGHNVFLPRSDWENSKVGQNVKDCIFIVPFMELFRHSEGYNNIACPTEYHMKYFPPFLTSNPPKPKTLDEIKDYLDFYIGKDSPEYQPFIRMNTYSLESLQ